MALGRLWNFFGTRRGMLILTVQLVLVLLFIFFYSNYQSSDRCVSCHADNERMTKLGYPQFIMTREQVQKESRHPNTECRDCHLGNGWYDDPAKAHSGMLKLMVLDNDLSIMSRKGHVPQLLQAGNDRLRSRLPRLPDGSLDYDVGTLLWHDRDPETLGYDPAIAAKTCGKSACHPEEVKQFSTSVMGANFRQRSMRHWTDAHGPNNCGPSFADTLPTGKAEGDRFAGQNTAVLQTQMNVTITQEQANQRQKACNICHTGCLDCHFAPTVERGSHAMSRIPPAMNCTGGGRSTFVCHAGTMERRRGDSYLGKDFSEPAGLPEDIHVSKKLECVDCHQTGPGGMGHIERKATCQDCHIEVEQAMAVSVHKKVSCEACHVSILGGYEMTSWGEGTVGGKPSPFKKYSLYYGPQKPPILVRDQKGTWMPVKIWPNSAGHIREKVEPKQGLIFRWPGGETRDAFVQLGTFSVPQGNNNYLAWLQLDQVAHPLGKSRTCAGCHGSPAQIAQATWEFYDSQGAEPFSGSHRVVADRNGLRITDLKATTKIVPLSGGRTQDFGAWLLLGDIWKTSGDFSIPPSDPKKYRELEQGLKNAQKKFEAAERALKQREAKGENVKKLRRRLNEEKAAGVHK